MVEFSGFILFGYVFGNFCLVSGLFKFFFGVLGQFAGLVSYTFLTEEVNKEIFNFLSITNCNAIIDSGVMLFNFLSFYFLKVIYSTLLSLLQDF